MPSPVTFPFLFFFNNRNYRKILSFEKKDKNKKPQLDKAAIKEHSRNYDWVSFIDICMYEGKTVLMSN